MIWGLYCGVVRRKKQMEKKGKSQKETRPIQEGGNKEKMKAALRIEIGKPG